jgi:predicted dehydrogenase
MRVGIVGYGYWGSKHTRVLCGIPGVQTTVIESDKDRRRQALEDFPMVSVSPTLEDALTKLDAVIVATPPRTHAPIANIALRHGVSVMCEKPLATNSTDCEALIALAEERNVTLMAGHTFEYNPAVWKLREIVRSGILGEVRYVDTARLNLGLYQSDVNVVWDLAPHDFSILNYIIDDQPISVSAWGARYLDQPVEAVKQTFEDVAFVRIQYANPAVQAYSHVSWLDPCKVRRVTVVGSQKMVVYNDMAAGEWIKIYDTGVDQTLSILDAYPSSLAYRNGAVDIPRIDFNEPLGIEDRHFIECVRSGEKPQSDGQSGLRVVQMLEATDIALREHRLVEIAGSGWRVPVGTTR